MRGALAICWLAAALTGCAHTPPDDTDNICSIFRQKPDWYRASERSFKRWGVPPQVQLAIVHQESSFRHDAKPPRRRLLGFIPAGRLSSAYGFAQVKDSTWDWYRDKTGNRGADRDDFADAVDFIGWYGDLSHRTLGLSKWDAYGQYLAYHEGHGGYRKGSYRKKRWLMKVARKVDRRAKRYSAQLARCRDSLDSGPWWWPF